MVLDFDKELQNALNEISFQKYNQFSLHLDEKERDLHSSCELISIYGEAKHQIVELLNQQFSTIKFDLINWINDNKNDELSYFLNEAGSNCLNYSQYKIPAMFHLWIGEKGFVVAVEQKGLGFNAQEIDNQRVKENEGAAFDFYRNCNGVVFFDNSSEAKIVYFQHLF
jgi:hypothetical protein